MTTRTNSEGAGLQSQGVRGYSVGGVEDHKCLRGYMISLLPHCARDPLKLDETIPLSLDDDEAEVIQLRSVSILYSTLHANVCHAQLSDISYCTNTDDGNRLVRRTIYM
ncbi:hypothetical protein CVT26_000998 [Gymnopilus dilepis]|uniref:Uncharacterized protein n=1 Tax=Gymnopilus dilepis TaxID=231916 RepID=A0A409YLB7_9AGAR|nr:hypothetical protein CVT26_000998 [Gymnopilus dilepis]